MKNLQKVFTIPIIIAVVTLLVLGGVYVYIKNGVKPTQDITGRNFSGDGFYSLEKEKMCCNDCLSHGDYGDSKDCLKIIQEHGGTKHCFMILSDYPHTFSQCKKMLTE